MVVWWMNYLFMRSLSAIQCPIVCAVSVTSITRQQNGFATRFNIKHTPTVFIDGKELPDIYDIQDIPFLF